MAINTKQVEETKVMAWAAIWIVLIGIAVSVVFWHETTTGIESLSRENNRQWEYCRTLSGAIDWLATNESVDDKYKILRENVRTELDNLELSKYAKIYDLDITICKAEHYQDHISDIKKRTVRMKNVVGINPSVERTAIVVETWLWYGSSVEIPTIMDDEEEYACGLEVISVK
jgi:hypothetical protein